MGVMDRSRIYIDEVAERYILNKGWTTDAPGTNDTVLHSSISYFDMVGNNIVDMGAEEFTIDRFNQMCATSKVRYTDIKVEHVSRNRAIYARKKAYRTIKRIYTYSNASIPQVETVIACIAKARGISFDLLKTK